MTLVTRTLSATLLIAGVAIGAVAPAAADVPGPHSYYLHALSDLRFARALLAVPEEFNAIPEQRRAIGEIDRAIGDLRHAAIDDAEPLGYAQPVDVSRPRIDRVREAGRALDRARTDIDRYESNGMVDGRRDAAYRDIDEALHQTRIELGIDHFDQTAF
jgi:hypothetical protein